MRIFDCHCDTAQYLLDEKVSLCRNQRHLDLERMEEYDGYIQVFAAFIDQKNITVSPMKRCMDLLTKLRQEIEKSGRMILIRDQNDLLRASQGEGCGAILSIEGGEALEGNLAHLELYYRMGVRLITLTWNYANELADGIIEERGGGLTDFGKKAVSAMEKMGILIDVSHLSVQGFWDVAQMAKKPFMASHSCVKSLCRHPRNLDDDQIAFLVQHHGGMGINFYPLFLTEQEECRIDHLLDHMEYVMAMGGKHILGLGSDFDGVSFLPEGICGAESLAEIVFAMKKRGWSKEVQHAICFENFYRLFSQIL